MARTYRLGIGSRLINRIFTMLTRLGLGASYRHILTVRGRKSGRIYSTPVDVMDGTKQSLQVLVDDLVAALNGTNTTAQDFVNAGLLDQNAVVTAVQNDPIHIWLYTNPRIFAYSPSVSGIPADLVQQRWEGAAVSGG